MNQKLLYTTCELFTTYLQGRKFTIPPYQRGYKWDTKDVVRLLKDLDEFTPDDELALFYCLQNITLVEKGDTYNVVDGQQRLTTLTLLLAYLGHKELIADKLQYSVRDETAAFLSEYIFSSADIDSIGNWDDFLELSRARGKDYDFQDIYYMFSGYKAIQAWFEDNPQSKAAMEQKVLNHLKMIVNLPRNVEEQELFENLNGKRVPLDGADLIRALIITRVAKKEIGDISDTTKHDVLINERRVKIGIMLDGINQWWSDTNRQDYFRHFARLTKLINDSSVTFNELVYPVNMLYRLYAQVYNNGKLGIGLFESESTKDGFLRNLMTLQRTIENWYNDRELYHLILFTSLYTVMSFNDLFKLWQSSYRKEFINKLKERIAGAVPFSDLLKEYGQSEEFNRAQAKKENWFSSGNLSKVCTLLDIIDIIGSHNDERLRAVKFKADKEDEEHIFPQTPIGDRIKDKNKQTQILKQYLSIINRSLPGDPIVIHDEEIDWDNQEWKDKVTKQINDSIKDILPINSLGNMCLLNGSVNRGYGNDFFLEKRIDVMTKSREGEGYYIRPHVYDAFNKAYINRDDNEINMAMMTQWNAEDIFNRRKYIINQIYNFLNKQEHEQA